MVKLQNRIIWCVLCHIYLYMIYHCSKYSMSTHIIHSISMHSAHYSRPLHDLLYWYLRISKQCTSSMMERFEISKESTLSWCMILSKICWYAGRPRRMFPITQCAAYSTHMNMYHFIAYILQVIMIMIYNI